MKKTEQLLLVDARGEEPYTVYLFNAWSGVAWQCGAWSPAVRWLKNSSPVDVCGASAAESLR